MENPTNPWVTMRYLSFWSRQDSPICVCRAYISADLKERAAHFGLSSSTLTAVPCETIAHVMNSSSQWNDSLRGTRLDLIPSCLRLFKAWVMLRALGSTATDSRSHIHSCFLSLSLFVCLSFSFLALTEGGSRLVLIAFKLRHSILTGVNDKNLSVSVPSYPPKW